MKTTKLPAKAQKAIARIALEHCRIETLEERRSDRLDFHDVSVWILKAALEAAYLEGVAHAMKKNPGPGREPGDVR
jgi:hypothetical protein